MTRVDGPQRGQPTGNRLAEWAGALQIPAMPLVTFTDVIQRHVPCPPMQVTADTIREALDAVFAANPRARGYVLDEQGALRQHMAVFIGGRQVRDRRTLTDPIEAGADIYVMQALSGG